MLLIIAFRRKITGSKAAFRCFQQNIKLPVLFLIEITDFVLPVHHHADRGRLHTPCRKPGLDGAPEHGRKLIADDAVKHTSRLLCVHQILVDFSWILNSVAYNIFGDFIEGHAFCLLIRQIKQLLQMPGDSFSLAVRVRCKINDAGFLRIRLQLFNQRKFVAHGYIFRFKGFKVNAERAFREIPEVAHGGLDLIVFSQILFNRLRLGRRLYDNEFFCHSITSLFSDDNSFFRISPDKAFNLQHGKLGQYKRCAQTGRIHDLISR